MKSRIANRFLLTAVMALMLCAVLAVSSFAAIGLTEEGKLAGLTIGKSYTAAPYDIIANTTGTAQSVDKNTDFDTLGAGIWAVSDGTTTEYVFVKGAESGQVSYWDTTNNVALAVAGDRSTKGLTTGLWTRGDNGSYKTTGPITVDENGVSVVLGTTTAQKASLSMTELLYGFTKNQVIPANAFTSWNVTVAFPTAYATGYSAANLSGTFTFYVKNPGDTEPTAITTPIAGVDSGSLAISAPAALTASNGYIVGIGFQPWANWTDGTNLYGDKNLPATIKLNKGVNTLGYTLKYAAADVEAASVSLNKTTLNLSVGDTYQLTATVLPENTTVKTVKWSSNDAAVTVNNGLVTAVSAGTATITVKTVNDKSATCTVTVTAEPALPNHENLGVTLAGTVDGLEEGKVYTIQSYDIITGTKGAKSALDATTVIDAGLWYVSNGEKGGYVFMAGEKSGEITYWDIANNKPFNINNTTSTAPVAGQWTRSADGAYVTITTYSNGQGTDQSVCLHFNKDKFLNKAEGATNYAGSTPKTGADNKLQESVIYYGFTAEQVVPASMVQDLTVRSMTTRTGACSYNTGKTSADHKGTFTFYVYNPVTGETTTYDVDTVGEQKVFTAPAAMASNEDGYVIGFAFAPFAKSADDLLVCASTDLNAANGYAHFGLNAGVNKLTLKASTLPAPKGLEVVDNKISGLKDGSYYQYAPVTLATGGVLTVGTPVALDGAATPMGLFVVRETNAAATNYTAWSDMLYIAGTSLNNILHTEQKTGTGGSNNGRVMDVPVLVNIGGPTTANVKVNTFNTGKWSGFSIGHGLQVSYGFTPLIMGGTSCYLYTEIANYLDSTDATVKAEKQAQAQEISSGVYFSYGYEPDEIIAMKDWASYQFKVTKRQGGLAVTAGALKTRVTLFVADLEGNVEERVALYDTVYDGSGKTITIKQEDFADNSGYIVGMKIQPYFAPEGTVLTPSSKTAVDYNLILMENTYKVVLPKQPKPTGLYIENGVVKGLNASKTYAWAYQYVDSQSASTTLPAGTTEISGKTGLLSIMIAGDNITTANSDPILFYVPGSANDRATIGQITADKPAFKTSSEWIPGTWTGSYLSWHDQTTGAYSFLDQTAGVAAGDAEKLWLYQNTKEQAQARLDADADKSAADGVPSAWTNNNVTSKPSRLQAVIDSHYAAADYAETLEANKAAHQQKIASAFETRYIAYAYDETEIIPVSQLIEMSFTHKSRQTDFTFTATPKTVFYVMDLDGTVTEYETMGLAIENKVGVWNKTTVDVQSIENWPTEGYVVGVKFYPYGEVEAESIVFSKTDMRVDASNIAYSFTQHHVCMGYYYDPYTSYVILAPAEAPTFEVSANANGEGYDVKITDYSSANVYEYKAAGEATWTTVTDGKFTVAETGTYTVKVSGDLLIGTAEADCVVEKLTPTAPTLEYAVNSADDFKVTIKNASALYTYEYKAAADADWTAVEGNSFVVAATGTYEVRATGEVWNGYATASIDVALATPEAPKVSVVPGEGADFTITIKNFSDLYTYEYKLDEEADWTAVPAGEKSFVIYVGGQYTIRAGGNVYDGYATTAFKAVEVPQAIKALEFDGTTLTGLDATLAYEFANVNYLGINDNWTAIPAGTEYTFVEPGLYLVRLAATGTEEASTGLVFNVLGKIADRGTIINLETKAYANGTNWDKNLRSLDVLKWTSYADKANPEFSVGRWSGWRVGDLPYWAQDWLTAIGSTNYVTHTDLGAKITAGTMSQEEVREFVSTFVFKYAYENTEIIPLTDLEAFKVRTGPRQGHLIAQGDVFTKFVFYIANDYGEVETRELLLKADYSAVATKTTHTISAADFEDVNGYIVAIDVYPFGYIPETTTFKVSGTTGQDYEAKFLDYQVKLPRIDAPTTLTFNEKTQLVEGFDVDAEYYYAPYTVNGVGEKKYHTGETLSLETGLWGIGLVSDDPEFADSLPYLVFVRGDEEARKTLGTDRGDGYFVASSGTSDFVQGSFTGNGAATHSSFGTNGLSTLGGHVTGTHAGNLAAAIAAEDEAAEAAARKAIEDVAATVLFRYAYANDEVIPSNELLNFKFELQKRMGSLNLGAGVTAKVTFYVIEADGSIGEYVWEEATSTTSKTVHDIDVQSIEGWPMDGYVVAIDINPWTKVNGDNVVVLDANKYNTMAQFNLTGYVIKLQPAAPELYTFDAPVGGLGEIAGLNSNMEYEYKVWDEDAQDYVGEWTKLPTNITSYRIKADKYYIRVAESRNFTVSDAVEIEVKQSNEARESLQNETKKIHLPNDFIELKANYEIDAKSKIWIARLALDNIKAVAPDSTLTIIGDGFKYVAVASDISTEKAIHYYNLAMTFNGDSRHDTTYEEIVKLAGDDYVTEFFTESVDGVPFEDAELYIYVGTKYDGQEVELRTYNERIGKLRKAESATVENGWVMFKTFGETYVIISTEE
ncbi:MAG: Ig domain-containing protein [Ruminococcaceae bacterium]|nr:Ig domain-containing protein [Oscillospiraceae bacterium]